ncbi:MAG TPA: GTP pyrophosphokinase [Elusimicrobia bacterium]|nr:GTP pyrophosphokinase [Elusimicrobiota bacterium]
MDLERAIRIAADAHRGQKDKAGAPYILHPLRVMLSLQGEAERIVGVLHDVLEDCPDWSAEKLRAEGFAPEVMRALDSLTKRPDEDYPAFIARAARDPIGRKVKVADLTDNLDIARIPSPTARDLARLERYKAALASLSDA